VVFLIIGGQAVAKIRGRSHKLYRGQESDLYIVVVSLQEGRTSQRRQLTFSGDSLGKYISEKNYI